MPNESKFGIMAQRSPIDENALKIDN